jgi:hypothetical protein
LGVRELCLSFPYLPWLPGPQGFFEEIV